MNEMKHTPGPWALESVNTSVGSCHKIGPFPSSGVRSEVHACVYADQLRLGLDDASPIAVELLANARLIASAPELLEALLALVNYDSSQNSDMSLLDNYRLWDAAESAIAKATGEQP